MPVTVVYAEEEPPRSYERSVFLAGPSPRNDATPSWRPECIQMLENAGFSGVVYVPLPREGFGKTHVFNFDGQVGWEVRHLKMADVVFFWIPRKIDANLPGFTTNVEFGLFARTGRCIMGYPQDADKMAYLDWWCQKERIPVRHTLQDTVQATLDAFRELEGKAAAGNVALHRTDGERTIPLPLWVKPEVQSWLQLQKASGNALLWAEPQWVLRCGPHHTPFLYALHVHVHIAAEGRDKTNEVVIFRSDVSSVVLYHLPDSATSVEDTVVVLVKEFRSPVRNTAAAVVEPPGGSSWSACEDPAAVAVDEVHEECGLRLDPCRVKPVATRQAASTLSAHRVALFSVHLTEEEVSAARGIEADNKVFGVEADGERTTVTVRTLREVMASDECDWTSVGMLLTAATQAWTARAQQ